MLSASDIIKILKLEPHSEGGYFRETYRAKGKISHSSLPRFSGDRPYSTAIYYLVTYDRPSKLHRLLSDEVYHYYLGGPLVIAEIKADGQIKETILGQDITAGHRFQYTVRAGNWLGAYVQEGVEFALTGCTVAPGFDYQDWELADSVKILEAYPNASKLIERLQLRSEIRR